MVSCDKLNAISTKPIQSSPGKNAVAGDKNDDLIHSKAQFCQSIFKAKISIVCLL